jgi:hypothetical protein
MMKRIKDVLKSIYSPRNDKARILPTCAILTTVMMGTIIGSGLFATGGIPLLVVLFSGATGVGLVGAFIDGFLQETINPGARNRKAAESTAPMDSTSPALQAKPATADFTNAVKKDSCCLAAPAQKPVDQLKP